MARPHPPLRRNLTLPYISTTERLANFDYQPNAISIRIPLDEKDDTIIQGHKQLARSLSSIGKKGYETPRKMFAPETIKTVFKF